MITTLRSCVLAFALLGVVSPAAAQWTRVLDLPASDVFTVWANGDTIAAGTATLVYTSTDGGATWKPSTQPASGVTSIQAVWIRNGLLYAGTFGQGVFVSDDLGDTWEDFNQGLVGGIGDSQLFIAEFQVLGDSLFAATLGAGVYVRDLAGGTWSHFGEEFEPNQASNVNGLGLGGTRLLAAAGANGSVFYRDPGDGDWTISWLDNVGLHPGLQALTAVWTGSGWVVGTTAGVFRGVAGHEPWTFSPLGLGPLFSAAFATRGRSVFGAFDIVNFAVIEYSGDDGATWHTLESQFDVFVYKLAMHGNDLYAGRADGLWRRSTATVSVPGGVGSSGLRFALAGPQPARDDVRFRFELPVAGRITIDVFDVTGRRAAASLEGSWSAGAHEVSWSTSGLDPGVYVARLTAAGRQEVTELVLLR